MSTPTVEERVTERSAAVLLALGLCLVAVFVLVRDLPSSAVVYLLCGAYGTALTFLGTVRMPPALCRPWMFIVAAQSLALLGDLLSTVYDDMLDAVPVVSYADIAYLLQYPTFALGMVLFLRSRRSGAVRDRAVLLDAAVLSTGFVVVGSVVLSGITSQAADGASWTAVVALGYPAGDLLVLAFVLRLFLGGMNRNPALWAMLGGVLFLLGADLFREASFAAGDVEPFWVDVGYLAVPVSIGAECLGPGRMVWLGLALAVAPVTGLVAHLTGQEANTWVTAVCGCVIALLVMLRLGAEVQRLGGAHVHEPRAPSHRSWAEVLRSLRTVYQPIFDLRTGELYGHEALARFDDEDPWSVFDRARRAGDGPAIESAAVRSAIAGWDHVGLLTINASLATLLSPELEEALPLDLSAIVIEVTEEDLANAPNEVPPALRTLRERGALIAIDDYGVGFSNVQRVLALRPDIIKLDRSLINGIDSDWTRQAAVASVRSLGDGLGADVLAEGIETEAERDTVRMLGIRLGQGFLLGRPAPLPDRKPVEGRTE